MEFHRPTPTLPTRSPITIGDYRVGALARRLSGDWIVWIVAPRSARESRTSWRGRELYTVLDEPRRTFATLGEAEAYAREHREAFERSAEALRRWYKSADDAIAISRVRDHVWQVETDRLHPILAAATKFAEAAAEMQVALSAHGLGDEVASLVRDCDRLQAVALAVRLHAEYPMYSIDEHVDREVAYAVERRNILATRGAVERELAIGKDGD